jgi:hypothetical protein
MRARSRLNPVRDAMVATKMATVDWAMKPVVADSELSGLACGLLSAASGRVRKPERKCAEVRCRRFSLIPDRPGDGLLSELTAGAQPRPRELLMPDSVIAQLVRGWR